MFKKSAAVLLMVSGSAMAGQSPIGFNNISARYIDSEFSGFDGDGFGLSLNVALTDYLFATVDYSDRSYDVFGTDVDLEFVRAGIGGNWGFLEDKSLQLYGALTWEQRDAGAGSGDGGGGGNGDGNGDGSDDGDTGGGSPIPTDPGALCAIPVVGDTVLAALGLCDSSAPAQGAGLFSKAATFNAGGESRLDGFGVTTGVRYMIFDNLEIGAEYQFRDYSKDDDTVIGTHVAYNLGNWQVRLDYQTYDKHDIDDITLGFGYIFGMSEEGSSSIW